MESTRNRKMVASVLKGYTYEQVGCVYGITGTRVRQIVMKVVGKIEPRVKGLRLKILRKYKNMLISLLEKETT